ncbi:MAG: aromatic ring-hydroxylating dioxygenase subunit alpha [Pseudonocardiales bacterium]|nr:aromatic ring-hydroxylating dioxygenase subunit alpha [Pseudonocardiales bacterium]
MPPTDLPPSLLATLPGRYYTDPAVFALEQSRIFEAGWFCCVRSADLTTPGCFETVQIGQESVLIARGCDGALNAFRNACRHRGARLCTDDRGAVKRSFRCPYHAWTYGLDGKLITVPNLTDMPDIDRTKYGLTWLAVREWLGYAWVCLADDPPSFEDTVIAQVTGRLGGPEEIDAYRIDELGLGRRINLVPDHVIVHRMFPRGPDRTLVRCDWLYLPEVIESGADLSRSVELFHRVNQQDFEACERCQLTMGSRAYARGGVLVPSEHHIGAFHDWLRAKIKNLRGG